MSSTAGTDLIKEMTTKAEAVQAVVSEIQSIPEAIEYAVELTRKKGGKTLAATGFHQEHLERLKKECETNELIQLLPPFRENAENIDTALTMTDGGIAETGSLYLKSSPENIRIATMLADHHVAVLPEEKIVADSGAISSDLDQVLKSEGPSYTAFITGASRTADIERVLAIGVHGPQELHILILRRNNHD